MIFNKINKLEENLKQELEYTKENQNEIAKSMNKQMNKINRSVEALHSKIYVNKE